MKRLDIRAPAGIVIALCHAPQVAGCRCVHPPTDALAPARSESYTIRDAAARYEFTMGCAIIHRLTAV